MRQFVLLIWHLTNIMEKTCTLSFLWIQSQLRCHHRTQICRLTCMLKKVLTIRRAVFHLTNNTYQFRMQSMNTQVYSRAFSCFNNLVIKLLLHFCHHFLDTSWMYTSICN